MQLNPPFLVFLGDAARISDAKTGCGLRDWRGDDCIGQLRLTPQTADIGLPDLSIEAAIEAGAQSMVIGVAPLGGRIPQAWRVSLVAAAQRGLDIVNGLHDRLTEDPELVAAASRSRSRLIDLRVPPADLRVGTGAKRSGTRLLTVGTDCAVGKKYTALAITAALRSRGASADFCATGQTGIMISGRGVPLDCVPCDFISGVIEALSPDQPAQHWDIIEGQGSLFHPSYAGVSLGLLHGAQPDAIIVCARAGAVALDDLPEFPVPSLAECADLNLYHARLTNPKARLVGISLNTEGMDDVQADEVCSALEAELKVPALDPLRHGMDEIAKNCLSMLPASEA